jgi:Cys-tRNA(Pro) deacylase
MKPLGKENPEGVEKVLSVLKENGIPYQLRRFEQPAHHARQAASLLGCELGAVVKSLVFTPKARKGIVLVLVSGKNRVNLQVFSKAFGASVTPACPEVVLSQTGYSVGAVPPFGFTVEIPVFIDQDLFDFTYLWASAGAANALMRIEACALTRVTHGQICAIH